MSNIFQVLRLLIMTATVWLSVYANQPRMYDCMMNPFMSGCRGISAKRSGIMQPISTISGRPELFASPRSQEMNLKSCSKIAARLWKSALASENPLEDYLEAINGRIHNTGIEK